MISQVELRLVTFGQLIEEYGIQTSLTYLLFQFQQVLIEKVSDNIDANEDTNLQDFRDLCSCIFLLKSKQQFPELIFLQEILERSILLPIPPSHAMVSSEDEDPTPSSSLDQSVNKTSTRVTREPPLQSRFFKKKGSRKKTERHNPDKNEEPIDTGYDLSELTEEPPELDSLKLFFDTIGRVQHPRGDEARILWQQIELGKRAKIRLESNEALSPVRQRLLENYVQAMELATDYMIRANAALVISIAKRYMFRGVPLQDLIQEGNIGLMKAVEKFELRRGKQFSTMATWWIRQAVSRHVEGKGRTVHIPAHKTLFLNAIYKASSHLKQELSRDPTAEEIARYLLTKQKKTKLTPAEINEQLFEKTEKVKKALKETRHAISLNDLIGDGDTERGDLIGNADPEVEDLATEEIDSELIDESLNSSLTAREKEIVQLRFGLLDGVTHTLEEIAQKFKYSRERIRKLEKSALKKLSTNTKLIELWKVNETDPPV